MMAVAVVAHTCYRATMRCSDALRARHSRPGQQFYPVHGATPPSNRGRSQQSRNASGGACRRHGDAAAGPTMSTAARHGPDDSRASLDSDSARQPKLNAPYSRHRPMQLNNYPGTYFSDKARSGLLHRLPLRASPSRSIRPKRETVFQAKTCIEQHTVRSTKQCLVLVRSHLRRRGKEGEPRPPRPAVVNRHRLSEFVPVFIADYQGANGGIIQPPA